MRDRGAMHNNVRVLRAQKYVQDPAAKPLIQRKIIGAFHDDILISYADSAQTGAIIVDLQNVHENQVFEVSFYPQNSSFQFAAFGKTYTVSANEKYTLIPKTEQVLKVALTAATANPETTAAPLALNSEEVQTNVLKAKVKKV